MALFKVLRGKRGALDGVQKTDGHAYFCTDDGSFWIDYKDAENVLHRKSINESQMAALEALVDTMQKSIEDLEASLVGKVDYLGTVSSMEGLSTTAGRGDYYRVITEFEFGTEIAHVGDVISATVDNPAQSILDWDLFHMEMGGSMLPEASVDNVGKVIGITESGYDAVELGDLAFQDNVELVYNESEKSLTITSGKKGSIGKANKTYPLIIGEFINTVESDGTAAVYYNCSFNEGNPFEEGTYDNVYTLNVENIGSAAMNTNAFNSSLFADNLNFTFAVGLGSILYVVVENNSITMYSKDLSVEVLQGMAEEFKNYKIEIIQHGNSSVGGLTEVAEERVYEIVDQFINGALEGEY